MFASSKLRLSLLCSLQVSSCARVLFARLHIWRPCQDLLHLSCNQHKIYTMSHYPTMDLLGFGDELPTSAELRTQPTVNPAAAPSFFASQQIRNVPVYSGRDCKMNVEDWIRDVQYMLDAAPRPPALQFSTIMRNLSGEARRLILNIPPHFQTAEKAFEELRAEYSDMAYSGDPMADFYEREQRQYEQVGSFAIALEGILCMIEERSNGGIPVADRDAKLTQQFMRGLRDEEVRSRLAPMKPREMTFQALKEELRQISRERATKRPMGRKPPQVQNAHTAASSPVQTDSTMKEVLSLLHTIKDDQRNQQDRMSDLEKRMVALEVRPAPSQGNRRREERDSRNQSQNSVRCWECGNEGHIARYCPAHAKKDLN